ncbi:serine/threonine-protein kinase [Rhodococcus aetherivorans]
MSRLEPGDVFAGYRIERRLGTGGMGAVYLAQHPRLPVQVALKLLKSRVTDDDPEAEADAETERQRFLLEADNAAALNHPNIVIVYDRGTEKRPDGRGGESDQLWIAMQYIVGTDAARALREDGPMPAERAVHIITETAEALDYAHHRGVLHRDVKPANILLGEPELGRPERVLLADFGIAKTMDTAGVRTKTGLVMASAHYAAPEQFRLDTLDRRADVYALGITLCELLTGKRPYRGTTNSQLQYEHCFEPIPRPSTLHDAVPETFDPVIRKALAKERDDRYPSCGALADAAQQALDTATRSAQRRKITWPGLRPRRAPTPAPDGEPSPDTVDPADAPTGPDPFPPGKATKSLLDGAHSDEADHERGTPVPDPPASGRHVRRRTVVFALVAVVLVVAAVAAILLTRDPPNPPPSPIALPFPENFVPLDIAVDRAGTVYAIGFSESDGNQVLKLPDGAATPAPMPIPIRFGLGVAVNSAATVYVTQYEPGQVLELVADATTSPAALPFPELAYPGAVAVDTAGAVYVAELGGNKAVLKLSPHATAPVVLPFSGHDIPVVEVAVGPTGAVYVISRDGPNEPGQVLKLEGGVTTTLPFPDTVSAVAVDDAGAVYATDPTEGQVLKLDVDATAPTALPVPALDHPQGLAIGSDGSIYVIAGPSTRVSVLKVPAGA